MQTKSAFVVGRDRELNALLDYVTDGTVTSEFTKKSSKEDNEDDEDNLEKRQQELLEGMLL